MVQRNLTEAKIFCLITTVLLLQKIIHFFCPVLCYVSLNNNFPYDFCRTILFPGLQLPLSMVSFALYETLSAKLFANITLPEIFRCNVVYKRIDNVICKIQ